MGVKYPVTEMFRERIVLGQNPRREIPLDRISKGPKRPSSDINMDRNDPGPKFPGTEITGDRNMSMITCPGSERSRSRNVKGPNYHVTKMNRG